MCSIKASLPALPPCAQFRYQLLFLIPLTPFLLVTSSDKQTHQIKLFPISIKIKPESRKPTIEVTQLKAMQ